MNQVADTPADPATSFIAPFRHRAYAVIWTATLISNVGAWMFSAASGWLMTSLNPDPLTVALVQAASTFPIFLLAIPAGAFADIFDKRKYLIVVESLYTAVSAVYAVIVGLGWANSANLLFFTLVIGGASALTAPAWQAVVPLLVPKDDLPAGIAANSIGVNIARALGPALGGAAWENMAAFETHAGFVKDHQEKVDRIAIIIAHDWQRWLVGARQGIKTRSRTKKNSQRERRGRLLAHSLCNVRADGPRMSG